MPDQKNDENQTMYLPLGMCLGLSLGMAIGSAMGNVGVGMCMGLGIGMCFGAAMDAAKRNARNARDEQGKEEE